MDDEKLLTQIALKGRMTAILVGHDVRVSGVWVRVTTASHQTLTGETWDGRRVRFHRKAIEQVRAPA